MSGIAISTTRRGARLLLVALIAIPLLIAGQAFLDPSGINIYCTVIAAGASALTVIYCLRSAMIERFPVSTMAVLGFCVTTYALPLVAQTLDGRPIVFNLLSPRETFEWTIAFQFVILLAHATYTHSRTLQRPSRWLAERVLRPFWVFRMPRAMELWGLGAMGMGASWISRILYSGDIDFGNVGGKFLQALVPFIVAPFFIPLRGLFLKQAVRSPTGTTLQLVGYFGLVVATAVFFNARGVFAIVLFTVLLATVLMISMRRLVLSDRAKIFIGIGALAVIPLTSVAQDLATAMQLARGLRGTASPLEIAQETVRAFGDHDALDSWRKSEMLKTADSGYSGYSEVYLNSEFLQRLTYTKYTDLTVNSSLRLTDFQRRAVREDAYEGIISIMPTPIINFLGLSVDKSNRGYSTGDVYANFGFNQEPGGQRTGSSITNSIDVLDVFWPPVIYLICIATFILLDSYSLKSDEGTAISAIAFILLYDIFARGLIYDSFRNLIDGITRSYVQAIVVYTILTLGARFAVAAFGSHKPRAPLSFR